MNGTDQTGERTGQGGDSAVGWQQVGRRGDGLGLPETSRVGRSAGGVGRGGLRQRGGERSTFADMVRMGKMTSGLDGWLGLGKASTTAARGQGGVPRGASGGRVGDRVGAGDGAVTADGAVTGDLAKNPDVTVVGGARLEGGTRPGDLADGVMGMVSAPLLKKSRSEFAVTMCFRGLAVTARMILGLVAQEAKGAASVKFLKGKEGVEVGFEEEDALLAAMEKWLMVGGVVVPMARCMRWDPRVV